jgi:cardiolipin synthase A/B
MWKERREGWTGSGRRERCVQVCQRIWATVDTTIKQSGVQVREDPQLYMHAKIIVVDNKVAFVGSDNISTQSLDQNRELGIIVSDSSVLHTLQTTFQNDWGVSENV